MKNFNVLVIVDMQNCFIQGGSLGDTNPEQIKTCIDQVKEIESIAISNSYDLIVFSKDLHPEYHSSLHTNLDLIHGVFPPHCRDKDSTCDVVYLDDVNYIKQRNTDFKKIGELCEEHIKRLEGSEKSYIDFIKQIQSKGNMILDLDVIGPNLSYLFFGTEYLCSKILCLSNTNELSTIGIDKNKINEYNKLEPNINYINWNKVRPSNNCIILNKGQFCRYESYSAFNYHVKIETKSNVPSSNELIKLPASKQYSTGLFEFILSHSGESKNINISVCGLVTNICIINSVQQGLAMWNIIYKSENPYTNVNFKLIDNASIPLPIDNPTIKYINYPFNTPIMSSEQLNNIIELFNEKMLIDVFIPNGIEFSEHNNLILFQDYNFILEYKCVECYKPDSTYGCVKTLNIANPNNYKLKYLKYKSKYESLKKNFIC